MRQTIKKIILSFLATVVLLVSSFVAPQTSRAATQWYIDDYLKEHNAYTIADSKPLCTYDREGFAQTVLDDIARNDAKATVTCSWKVAEKNKDQSNLYYSVIYDEDNLVQRIEQGVHSVDRADNGFCQLMPYANDLYVCYYGRYQEKVSFELVLNKSLVQQLIGGSSTITNWFDTAFEDFKKGLVVAVSDSPPVGMSRVGLGALTNTEWDVYKGARAIFDTNREGLRNSTINRPDYEKLVADFDARRNSFSRTSGNQVVLCDVDSAASAGDALLRTSACGVLLADLNRYKRALDQYRAVLTACVDQDGKRITSDACTQAKEIQKKSIDNLELNENQIATQAAQQNNSLEGASNTARGVCSDGVPLITEVVDGFGTWLGCTVAYGLISTKKFIIDSWLIQDKSSQGKDDLFGNVLNIADPTLGESNLVVSVWSIIRDVVNALVLISILIMALLNATGFARSKTLESFQFQRLIPSIVVAVILVNFSLAICNFFIIAANALTNYMVGSQGLQGIASAAGTGLDSIAGKTPGTALFQALFLVAFSLILLYLYILLWVRVVVISLLVMTSGLPYIARILPFKYVQETVSSFWTKQFVNWLLMGPMVGLLVYIAARAITGLGQSAFLLPQGTENAVSGSPTLTNLIVVTVILYIAATYPLKLGGDIMKRAQGYLKKAGEGAGTFARRTAKGVAVASEKEGAGALTKAAGKVASTGLFVTGLPKYLPEQYKKIEEDRDKKLSKSWDKNKGIIGKTRRFVTGPLIDTEIDEGSDKIKNQNIPTLELKAQKPDKGPNDPVTWKDRAKAQMAIRKKIDDAATEQDRIDAITAWERTGIGIPYQDVKDEQIIEFAKRSTVGDPWTGVKGTSLKERLGNVGRNKIAGMDGNAMKGRDYTEALALVNEYESRLRPEEEAAFERVYENILGRLKQSPSFGEENLSEDFLRRVRNRIKKGDINGMRALVVSEFERLKKAGASVERDPALLVDKYESVTGQQSGIFETMEKDQAYQRVVKQNSSTVYENAQALIEKIQKAHRSSEAKRLDPLIKQASNNELMRTRILDRLRSDIEDVNDKLVNAVDRNVGFENAVMRLREIDRPSFDVRVKIDDAGRFVSSDITSEELRDIIQAKQDVVDAYASKRQDKIDAWLNYGKTQQGTGKKKKI